MGAYVLYVSLQGGSVRIGVTGAPSVTAAFLTDGRTGVPAGEVVLVSSPLPLGVAEAVQRDVERTSWLARLRWPVAVRWALRRRLRRALASVGAKPLWRVVGGEGDGAAVPEETELQVAARLLGGRILLENEAVRLLETYGEGVLSAHPYDLIEGLVVSGRLTRRPAVVRDDAGRWQCLRCGARDRIDVGVCVRCGRDACAACTECARLGAARACEGVVWAPPVLRSRRATTDEKLLQLDIELSPAQRQAAERLLGTEAKRALVWAACGAGKTEVVYPLIERALQQGSDVLFAVPRRDIVVELGRRVQAAFPGVPVHALYGGSPGKFADARLVVATTHQVMRLYRRFDLVVLDEVDAFPYRGSAVLRRAVERARAPDGRLVYMTATPSESMLRRAGSPGWCLAMIPARHHGRPLPVPAFLIHKGMERLREALEQGTRPPGIPRQVAELFQRLVGSGRPLLVFVPTVRLVAPTAKLIDGVLRSGARPAADALPLAYGIHSRDPRRDALRESFRRGEFPVLVATTVLERGITISGVQAVVMWADFERVFDGATLIQMAGRVGRTREQPDGEVHFVAARITRPMHEARARISELNAVAAELGHLRADPPAGRRSQAG